MSGTRRFVRNITARRPLVFRRIALLWLLVFSLGAGKLVTEACNPVQAQNASPESFMVNNETAYAYRKVPEIESQLYGHAYPNQALSLRMLRIEKTLFGTGQRGPLELRMQRIDASMTEKNSKDALAEQEPMIEYLEEKLFQRTYPEKPLPDRMHQLEMQVFGRSFDSYPVSVRFKKLTYAMPLVAKEIRLSKGDMVVASTRRRSSTLSPRSGPAREDRDDSIQLDASAAGTTRAASRVLPDGAPLSTGDYYQSVYRNTAGAVLRWSSLPIRVFVKPGASENAVTMQALRLWSGMFSVVQSPTAAQADVIVSWDKYDWDQNASGLMTRPLVHMGDRQNLRTVIYIEMYPLRTQQPLAQLHALSHQLGHAFGLWGHSDDPDDLMYPALSSERNDFPAKWAWRSTSTGSHPPDAMPETAQPSQRDINTLLKIYDQPASDLSTYNPY